MFDWMRPEKHVIAILKKARCRGDGGRTVSSWSRANWM